MVSSLERTYEKDSAIVCVPRPWRQEFAENYQKKLNLDEDRKNALANAMEEER